MSDDKKYLYRYESRLVSSGDEEYGYYSHNEVLLYRYEVVRETPKGCWVKMVLDKPRFVLNDSRKKFACRTPELALALESFKARKAAYVRILRSRIATAEDAVQKAEDHQARLAAGKMSWPHRRWLI